MREIRFHESEYRKRMRTDLRCARVELMSAGSRVWTSGEFRPGGDTLTFLCNGPSYGFQNTISHLRPVSVARTGDWLRMVPANRRIFSERPPGEWSYLLITFHDSIPGLELSLDLRAPALTPMLRAIVRNLLRQHAQVCPRGELDGLVSQLYSFIREKRLGIHGVGVSTMRRAPQWNLKRVTNYIEAELGKNLSVNELASVAKLNRSHFSGVFCETVGVSPHQYVLERRLQRGKEALETAHCPITEVALEHGFSSASHFSTAFRKRFGYSPRDVARPPLRQVLQR